eukprot:3791964-Pyramimonas_sp.AAC.1
MTCPLRRSRGTLTPTRRLVHLSLPPSNFPPASLTPYVSDRTEGPDGPSSPRWRRKGNTDDSNE